MDTEINISINYQGHDIDLEDIPIFGHYDYDPGAPATLNYPGDPPCLECEFECSLDEEDAIGLVREWIEADMGRLQRWWRSLFDLYDGEEILALVNEQIDNYEWEEAPVSIEF